jgi:hypothetical protein
MNKNELLTQLEESREKFLDALGDLQQDQWVVPGVVGEWSIKDILAHLSRWEAEMVKLLWQARQGVRPTTMHFAQGDVDETNRIWFNEARARSLEHVLEDFHAVRNQTLLRVEAFADKVDRSKNIPGWNLGHYGSGWSVTVPITNPNTLSRLQIGAKS